MDKIALKQLWTGPDAFGTTLLLLTANTFGLEAINEWLPDTRLLAIEEHFDCPVGQLAFDKLEAAITVVKTDRFTQSLPSFIELCNVLGGSLYDPNMWDPAEVVEMCWAVLEAAVLWPPQDDTPPDEVFCDDITQYMGRQLDAEGFVQTPLLLSMAQRDPRSLDVIQQNLDADADGAAVTLQLQTEKISDLNAELRRRLRQLTTQISQLPFDGAAKYAEQVTKAVMGLISDGTSDGDDAENSN